MVNYGYIGLKNIKIGHILNGQRLSGVMNPLLKSGSDSKMIGSFISINLERNGKKGILSLIKKR